MTKVSDLHKKCSEDPKYRRAHAELAPEFELARAVIQARTHAGLTQEQLARRMAAVAPRYRLQCRAQSRHP